MFAPNSKNFKLNPAVQILEDEFIAGYVIELLDSAGHILSQRFSSKTKNQIMEDLKVQNGFKSKGQKIIDALLEGESL